MSARSYINAGIKMFASILIYSSLLFVLIAIYMLISDIFVFCGVAQAIDFELIFFILNCAFFFSCGVLVFICIRRKKWRIVWRMVLGGGVLLSFYILNGNAILEVAADAIEARFIFKCKTDGNEIEVCAVGKVSDDLYMAIIHDTGGQISLSDEMKGESWGYFKRKYSVNDYKFHRIYDEFYKIYFRSEIH